VEKPASTFGDEAALVEEIRKDAETKADRVRRRAEHDSRKTIEDAAKEAQANVQGLINAAKARAESESSRLERSTRQETKRRRLSSQEDVIQLLFVSARQRLMDKRSYDYRRTLAQLAAAAIAAMRGSEFKLHLSSQDADFAGPPLIAAVQAEVNGTGPRALTLSAAADQPQIAGGILVRSADGHQEFDNSFEARLSRSHTTLRAELADIVFKKQNVAGAESPGNEG